MPAPRAWVDLEPVLDALAPNLASGELIHDAAFSLFDAMSALDVGDRKMDAGSRAHEVVTLEQMISLGRVPPALSPRDAVLESDALLACECAYRSGHAAAMTLWSNARIAGRASGTAPLGDPATRASVLATIASAGLALEAVKLGDVYEEEDFAVQAGDPLDPSGGKEKTAARAEAAEALAALRDAREWLEKETSVEEREREALRARFEFRVEHLEMMTSLIDAVGTARGDGVKRARACAERAKVCLNQMREYYADVANADELDWDPNGGSFSHEMSMHMLGGAPPREVRFLSRRRAIDYLEKEIDDVLIAANVFKFRASGHVPIVEDVLDSLERLQDVRPGAVALAVAAAELLHDKKLCGAHVGHVALKSAWHFSCVKDARLDSSFAHPDDALNRFVEECVQPLTILVRSYCVNRPRFRRCLRRCLGEFSHLQAAAEALDAAQYEDLTGRADAVSVECLRSLASPFVAWTERLCATAQLRHVELGFSLDLYLPHEFPIIYFYMQQLQLLRTNDMKRQTALLSANGSIGADVFESPHFTTLMCDMIKLMMYYATCYAFLALIERGKVRKCETPFSGEDLRFWQRFSTFQSVDFPQALTYDDYVGILESSVKNRKERAGATTLSDVDIYVDIAVSMYKQAREQSKMIPVDVLRRNGDPRADRVDAAAKIAAKNAVALKLLLSTDMTCDIDASDELFVAITAKKPAE